MPTESNSEIKDERFLETFPTNAKVLFKFKGILVGKNITISISPAEGTNYIAPKLVNQLMIPESNIIGKLDCLATKYMT